jgi:hypothetical protein
LLDRNYYPVKKKVRSIMTDSETLGVQVGQKVLLFDETVQRGRSKKLSPQYIGPSEVLAVEGVNVVKKGRTAQKVHINGIRPFY